MTPSGDPEGGTLKGAMMAHPDRVIDKSRADHSIESAVLDERCILCGELAAHIVIEQTSTGFPPMVSHLCCTHFKLVVGDCSSYTYELPTQRD
jgi:hypothetical protein